MPIRKDQIQRYPKNWREIRERIRERAGDKCEQCGVENGAVGHWDNGAFIYVDAFPGRYEPTPDAQRNIKIVCTTAHLDHTPENCADDNLRFWCQRCHNSYDAPIRARGIKERARRQRAIGDLFHG